MPQYTTGKFRLAGIASLCLVCAYSAADSPPDFVGAPGAAAGRSASAEFRLTGTITHVAQPTITGGAFTISISPLVPAPADSLFSNGFEVVQ